MALKSTCLIAVLLTGIANAHGGFENETEVRVYPDRMRVVVRSSLPFAWTLLGDRAPRTADEAGQAVAKPLFAAAAADLFSVTSAGKPMTPEKSDCLFEVHDLHPHVAFSLDYPRPTEWPVTLEARFFPLLGELDTGTVAVFDHSASRFSRDIEPLVRKVIDGKDPVVSFDLGPPKIADEPKDASPPPPVAAAAPAERPGNPWFIVVVFVAAGIAGWLARAAWRRSRPAA